MDFLGIGGSEVLLILVIVLLVFGPTKLPEIARTLGETTRKMKETSSRLVKEVSQEMEDAQDAKKEISELVQKAVLPLDEKSEPKGDDSKPGKADHKIDAV